MSKIFHFNIDITSDGSEKKFERTPVKDITIEYSARRSSLPSEPREN
jgi:hypothetical protein